MKCWFLCNMNRTLVVTNNLPITCFLPNSSINLCNQIIPLLASIAPKCFASVVESATMFCNFETQQIVVPPTLNTYPMVLLLLSLSLVISTSTYPSRESFEPPKLNAWFMVPLKYLRIHFTAIQCSFPELFIYLLINPTTCAISGLVQTISHIKLPTTNAYGTLHI